MILGELLSCVSPPDSPVHPGTQETQEQIEELLGISLPEELWEFSRCYGTGIFNDSLEIYNPGSPSYVQTILMVSQCYRDLKQSEGDSFIPYQIYPEQPGLLVCGSEANGHLLFWITKGEPNQWPLVLMTVDCQFEEIGHSISAFLAETFRGARSCVLWDKCWARENFSEVEFHPTQT